jgi:hypothetical protein
MSYKLSPLHTIHQLFFYLHCLSIDIALGACLLTGAFTLLLPIKIPFYLYALLFNCTLLVYWLDHLQDSNSAILVQQSKRHLLFSAWRKAFMVASGVILLSSTAIVFLYLNLNQIIIGSSTALLAGIYLQFHRKWPRILWLEKEFWIATLYTLAIALVPIITLEKLSLMIWPEILSISGLIGCAALINILSVARIEAHIDQQTGIRNLATQYSSNLINNLQYLIFTAQLMTAIGLYLLAPFIEVIYIGIPLILNSILQLNLPAIANRFKQEEYRFLGEWAFISCGLFYYFI